MRKAFLLAALLASVPVAGAGEAPVDRLVETYASFAGSADKARALVLGLREKSSIVLSPTVTIEPPTAAMGLGNIDISLALAQASLNEQGISAPTPEQLQAALLGGSVTRADGVTATLPGVLDMRAGGMGWGEIAHTLGFKLGELMRSERAQRVAMGERGRPEHAGRPERPERPTRLERPDRPQKPERAGR
jgi:hypothetical protein